MNFASEKGRESKQQQLLGVYIKGSSTVNTSVSEAHNRRAANDVIVTVSCHVTCVGTKYIINPDFVNVSMAVRQRAI